MSNQLNLFDNNADFYQADVTNFSQGDATFKVHASLIYKLGESLIADEVTALSELIKNSYDADAKFCVLSIDTNYEEEIDGKVCKGKIELIDNGCGMNLETIVNGWLTLSNSPKKKMKKEKKTTPKYKRYPLGDKGLGRLSVQKLGRYMQMVTKAVDSKVEYTVVIPWGDFLKNTTIDQIPVRITQNQIDNDKSYTKITIKDLVNVDLWTSESQINVLSNSINKIVSPFKSKGNTFRVSASIDEVPIEPIDNIFNDLLSRARARHTISYKEGKSDINSYITNSFFYNRELMKSISKNQFSLNTSALDDFWNVYKSKLPMFSFNREEKNVFTSDEEYLFEDLLYDSDLETQNENDPGPFECEIYEYTLDQDFLDNYYDLISFSELIDQTEYRTFIDRFHGVKVVRDGFVVQGYGEGDGGDWLGLSAYSKTTGRYFDLRNDSVIGCVYISGKDNYSLKETTNREGFVEDSHFETFKRILTESIKRINRNRNKLNSSMRSYVAESVLTSSENNTIDDAFNNAINNVQIKMDVAEKVNNELSNAIENASNNCKDVKESLETLPFVDSELVSKINALSENTSKISEQYSELLNTFQYLDKQLNSISYDFEKINERLRDLFELAGLGISVEMFTHEFDSSVKNIRLKNNAIINRETGNDNEELIKHLQYISYALDILRKQMSYFNPGLKFVRSEKQTISFSDFVLEHKEFYSERCKNERIQYLVEIKNDFLFKANRGMMNQVLDNLFNNSEYWLDFSKNKELIDEKVFSVCCQEKGIFIVSDNGIGISKDIENTLFEPFESKKENGRGLGLYIVSNNLKYHNARIRLLGERNTFGNLYKFEVDLTALL
ncbi:MAG: ATP-binding protein [Eubacterium sp.]|nr:ATP-binding protein [Eubacterium sp.]